MSKNILICTESLATGGVEAVVFNQSIALKEAGNNVYILSGDGEYRQKIEEKGIEWIPYNFKVKNTFDTQDVDHIVSIIKEKNINQIYVHKIICIPFMLMICSKVNLPYIAYVHDELPETYDWFIDNFNIYDLSVKLFFKNAYKIICISEKAKQYHQKRFGIDDSKYLVIKNSVNFDIYKCNHTIQKNLPENFVIVSRIAHEKFISVKNSIELFCAYSDKVPFETKLTIIGDGDKVDELKKILESKKEKYHIEYKGATNDVVSVINENDVVLGLNRCALEAMAIKRIVVLSGYENLKGIITPENIDMALEDNLSGNNLENISKETQLEQLLSLSKEEIERITQENYHKIEKENNINNNIYIIQEDVEKTNFNYEDIYSEINKISEKIGNLKQENDNIWKAREYFKEQAEEKEKEIEDLKRKNEELIKQKREVLEENKKNKEELIAIKNRKIYKVISRITNKTKFKF